MLAVSLGIACLVQLTVGVDIRLACVRGSESYNPPDCPAVSMALDKIRAEGHLTEHNFTWVGPHYGGFKSPYYMSFVFSNVSSSEQTFSPRKKGFLRGVKVFSVESKGFPRGRQVFSAEQTYYPRSKGFLRWVKVLSEEERFSPRSKPFLRGKKVFSEEYSPRSRYVPSASK